MNRTQMQTVIETLQQPIAKSAGIHVEFDFEAFCCGSTNANEVFAACANFNITYHHPTKEAVVFFQFGKSHGTIRVNLDNHMTNEEEQTILKALEQCLEEEC